MKLYGSLTSPYVRKIRILLAEKGLPYELCVADVWAADSPIPALNPLGKVPVLVGDDGEVWFDSALLIELLDVQGVLHLIPAAPARWEALRWHALAQGMLDATVTRLLEHRRPQGLQQESVVERQEAKITASLQYLERALAAFARRWLVGDAFGIADIAVGVALGYIDFRYPHAWRAAYPRLAEWSAPVLARESFVATAPPP